MSVEPLACNCPMLAFCWDPPPDPCSGHTLQMSAQALKSLCESAQPAGSQVAPPGQLLQEGLLPKSQGPAVELRITAMPCLQAWLPTGSFLAAPA